MHLPATYFSALLLALLSALCWGLWPHLYKLGHARDKRWRFELFYFDFSLGVAIAASVAAFTFGTLGFDGLAFPDVIAVAAKRKMAWAAAAGAVFNLGNLLVLAAASVAGLAVAYLAGTGLALAVSIAWLSLAGFQAEAAWLYSSAALGLLAAVIGFAAHRMREARRQAQIAAAKPPAKRRKQGLGAWKGILLATFGGLLLGCLHPLIHRATQGDDGVGPYGAAFFLAGAVVLSTFVYNLFFMNLPVEGQPVDILTYFKSRLSLHVYGLLGGILWGAGAILNFCAFGLTDLSDFAITGSAALAAGAGVVAALIGMARWKEASAGSGAARSLLLLAAALSVAGAALAFQAWR
jgi:glucose uptake protein